MVVTNQIVYSRQIKNLGEITIRPIQLEKDINLLHSWVTQPYAKYWGMLDYTLEKVQKSYQEIKENPHHHAYIGMLKGVPVFLMERYKASEDLLAKYYNALDNDYGMHILVAPVEKRIPQFTWFIFTTVMEYFFSLNYVSRVVVEPDKHNKKIHILNKKAGFIYDKEIKLPHKTAILAFCTQELYVNALK